MVSLGFKKCIIIGFSIVVVITIIYFILNANLENIKITNYFNTFRLHNYLVCYFLQSVWYICISRCNFRFLWCIFIILLLRVWSGFYVFRYLIIIIRLILILPTKCTGNNVISLAIKTLPKRNAITLYLLFRITALNPTKCSCFENLTSNKIIFFFFKEAHAIKLHNSR